MIQNFYAINKHVIQHIMEYYEKLRQIIDSKGIKIEKLANSIDSTKQSMYNYLNGSTKMPAEILVEPFKYLGLTVEDIINENKPSVNIQHNGTGHFLVGKGTVYQNDPNLGSALDFLKKENEELKKQIEDLKRDKEFLQTMLTRGEVRYDGGEMKK